MIKDSEIDPKTLDGLWRARVCVIVIGVGTGGIAAVNHMIASDLQEVAFIAADTDAEALANAQAKHIIQLGPTCCKGLGTEGELDAGRQAAEESLLVIKEAFGIIDRVGMFFVVAGMGGGTGTGAAAVIAKAAKDAGAYTIGVISKPSACEGEKRLQQAQAGMQALLDVVDILIAIPSDKLVECQCPSAPTTHGDTLRMADEALYRAVKFICDSVSLYNNLISLDLADVHNCLSGAGMRGIGIGIASGSNRAIAAVRRALNDPLLEDVSIGMAKSVLYRVEAPSDIVSNELDEIDTIISDWVHNECKVYFSLNYDDNADDTLRITIMVSGAVLECPLERTGLGLPWRGNFSRQFGRKWPCFACRRTLRR